MKCHVPILGDLLQNRGAVISHVHVVKKTSNFKTLGFFKQKHPLSLDSSGISPRKKKRPKSIRFPEKTRRMRPLRFRVVVVVVFGGGGGVRMKSETNDIKDL